MRAKIFYFTLQDEQTKEEKLDWFEQTRFENIPFDHIMPDRLGQNGIIAFITNRSFIDSKTFDRFRKCIERDFDYIYIVDTQSDVRNNPKISGTKNNIFGIQTGIAIMFLVKAAKEKKP